METILMFTIFACYATWAEASYNRAIAQVPLYNCEDHEH